MTTQSIFRDVVKVEGYRGLMKGFAPSLLLHAMFLGGYFVVYEGSKRAMLSTSETLSKRPFIAHILGGALAGSVVAGVTTPMDVSAWVREARSIRAPARLIYAVVCWL